ncbi:MAG TPA: flagellar motor protein MotB [Vicinamibacteria bacterium]|nr:flagellar motor protein MotB [Vicinamibacteria bacterium]
MAKLLGLLLVILLAAGAAFYFLVLQPQQNALATAEQAAVVCAQQLASLRGQVADLTIIRDQLQRSGAELAEKVAEKENELLALRSTQDELVSELKGEIADKTVQVERIRDQLRVDLVDEVLFDSGEATLKPAGIAVFGKIGAVLAKATDRRIEVQGHTDNVPITGALAKRFATNWELSAARATNVVRFLQDQAKLDPTRLCASGYAEFRPKGPNDTAAGRRQNRRIEILLIPIPAAVPPEAKPAAGRP